MNIRHSSMVGWEKVGKRFLAIPPNFFSITMGLAGLAGVWRLAGNLYGFPLQIADALYLVTTLVYLVLVVAFVTKLVLSWQTVLAEMKHPVAGPFNSLLPISGMLLALGLEPHAHQVAQGIFFVFLIATVLFGGWITGQWIADRLDPDTLHSGYFLPTVAGGLIGGEGLARFGMVGLGWLNFGIGMICWLLLGSIILNRLLFRPSLPQGLIPTLAIEVAPPVVAGNAYFALTGGNINLLTYMLAGYAVLMLLVQLRLVWVYSKLTFAPTFWAFTFPFTAVAAYALHWINLEHSTMLLGYAVVAAITLLVGSIALRSLVALWNGTLLSSAATPHGCYEVPIS